MRTTITAVGVLIALTACQEPARPTAIANTSADAAANGDEGNFLAFGAGVTQLPPGFGRATLSFHANAHADGSATGTFRMFRVRNGLTSDFEGSVTCLSIDLVNGRAWIGGVVTANSSTDPNQQLPIHQPGQDVWFRVQDNGKHELEPDRSTVLGFFMPPPGIQTSAQYCATQPWPANNANTFPFVDGDAKVKP